MSAFFEQVRNSTTGALDKAKLVFNRDVSDDAEEQQEEASWTEDLANYCPTLTFQQRLIGFACSFGLGYLIAFMSFRFFLRLVGGNPLPFAINYTSGHVLQLLASMFLCGPKRQFKCVYNETGKIMSSFCASIFQCPHTFVIFF